MGSADGDATVVEAGGAVGTAGEGETCDTSSSVGGTGSTGGVSAAGSESAGCTASTAVDSGTIASSWFGVATSCFPGAASVDGAGGACAVGGSWPLFLSVRLPCSPKSTQQAR